VHDEPWSPGAHVPALLHVADAQSPSAPHAAPAPPGEQLPPLHWSE
jgi:hypothetical protein